MTPYVLFESFFPVPVYVSVSSADMPSERCKLPAYVPHDPLLWFRAVEANFSIHKVLTEKDRASLTIAALPERQLQTVGDLLDVPPLTSTRRSRAGSSLWMLLRSRTAGSVA